MISLPPKFYPYLLNHKSDEASKKLCNDLNDFFLKKSYIEPICHSFPGWVIKRKTEGKTADQHLYRVRKAEKIQACIKANHLTCFTVPEKHLFRYEDQFYVLSEFMKGEPAFISDFSEKEILELTEISLSTYFLDFTHNFIRLPSRKIAIIDTESRLRSLYKSLPSCSMWVGGPLARHIRKSSLKRIHALNSCYEFSNLCKDPVKHVFTRALNRSIQSRVAKLWGAVFGILFLLSTIAICKPEWLIAAAILSWIQLYNIFGIIKREVMLYMLPLAHVN